MAANVHPPPMFLPCPGDPALPFNMWMRMFNSYLLVINATGNAWPEARRRATLLHCLGTEGQRIFYSLPNTGDTFASAVTALEQHFSPKVNVVVERHAFRKRTQASHETVIQYVASLRDLASKCEFDDRTEEMIRDQLVEHVSSPSIRERLLLEPDLTLDKAVTLATQMESAVQQAKSVAADSSTPVQAVQSHSHSMQRKHKYNAHPAKPSHATKTSKNCFRCGSNTHLANFRQCPAAKVTCKLCHKIGHFARVCCSSKTRDVREVHLPKLTVLYLTDPSHASKGLQCSINVSTPTSSAKDIELIVDTGSAVSILPNHIYEEHFSGTPLKPPDLQLVTYTKKTIPVLGCLQVTVSRGNASASAVFFVVRKGTPLLGRDLMEALNVSIAGNTVLPPCTDPTASVMSTNPSPASCIPAAPDIGCVRAFVHKVKVDPTVKPVRQKLRRLPFAVRASVSAELDRLLKAGVIERIDASSWVSPIVVTGRKTGGIRLCADLREPNKAVITDCYPLPHVDELFASLQGAKMFSTIDLANAYYQLPLHEDSRDLTAFITHDGLFRFCRVPYGLASAPSAFQKMMAEILKDLPGVQNYLDDLIVYSKSAAEHDQNLSTVLQKLKDAGLVLNENKCHFRKTSLRFLGHVVTADGILPDEEHIDAVLRAPPPSDAVALRSFLGLVSWYSKFLPNFATVVAPMRACANDKNTFTWTSDAQVSFEEVKKLVVNSPALALFDPALRVVISTDASDYGLGAVFAQVQPDGTEKPVAFASRTLSATEQKYSTVEKEAYACVWAAEKWRTYLWGRRFTLRTDHQALTTLLSTKGINTAGMRIARWSARLLCFDYDVIYRPGSQNYTADCLSPAPACFFPSHIGCRS
uniref:Reverse transcriptase domain-containing protein n=1 Tax=Oreochromis niloticus TaxID=8128 RepID=A0A669FAM3_ORENI